MWLLSMFSYKQKENSHTRGVSIRDFIIIFIHGFKRKLSFTRIFKIFISIYDRWNFTISPFIKYKGQWFKLCSSLKYFSLRNVLKAVDFDDDVFDPNLQQNIWANEILMSSCVRVLPTQISSTCVLCTVNGPRACQMFLSFSFVEMRESASRTA